MKTPTQSLHSVKSSRDFRNLCFSLTFQVTVLHSSERTKKTSIRTSWTVNLLFFCLFDWSLLRCRTRLLTQSRNRCSALYAQRPLCPEIALSRSLCSYITSLFFYIIFRFQETHRRSTRDVVTQVSFFASRKSLAAPYERAPRRFDSFDASHSLLIFRSIVETITEKSRNNE